MLDHDFVDLEQFDRQGDVDHLGDGWGLFQTISTQRFRDPRNQAVCVCGCLRRSPRHDLAFAFRGRILDAQVQAAAT